MKFLFIYKYSEINGGIQDMIRKISEHLSQQGNEVYILSEHEDYKKLKTKKEEHFKVYHLNYSNLLKILFAKKINIVCVFEPYKTYIYRAILIKIFKRKVIANLIFCGSKSEDSGKNFKRFSWLINIIFNRFIAISEYGKKIAFGNKYLDKIKVIYPPIAIENYRKTNFSKYNIITINRISPRKNYHDLIKMFNLVHKINPDIHLDIVGGYESLYKDYYNEIVELVDKLSLNEYITFHGDVSEEKKIQLLSESRIYITTSKHEMFGITTAEAMASGLPIIAYNNTTTKEIVSLGGGILVDDGRFDLMAEEVINLIDNEAKIKSLSEKHFFAAKRFNHKRILKEYEKYLGSYFLKNNL